MNAIAAAVALTILYCAPQSVYADQEEAFAKNLQGCWKQASFTKNTTINMLGGLHYSSTMCFTGGTNGNFKKRECEGYETLNCWGAEGGYRLANRKFILIREIGPDVTCDADVVPQRYFRISHCNGGLSEPTILFDWAGSSSELD